jgi:hypothetical protein
VAVGIERASLEGEWIHHHEQDSGERQVFVRAGTPLPRSRGRRRLALRPDGALEASVPGRADAPERLQGSWNLEPPNRLRFVWATPEAGEERFRVEAVDTDRLVWVRIQTGSA